MIGDWQDKETPTNNPERIRMFIVEAGSFYQAIRRPIVPRLGSVHKVGRVEYVVIVVVANPYRAEADLWEVEVQYAPMESAWKKRQDEKRQDQLRSDIEHTCTGKPPF